MNNSNQMKLGQPPRESQFPIRRTHHISAFVIVCNAAGPLKEVEL